MVVGILAIVYRYIAGGDGERLQVFAQANQWFVPTLLLVPMAIGIFLQNKLSKTDQNWAG